MLEQVREHGHLGARDDVAGVGDERVETEEGLVLFSAHETALAARRRSTSNRLRACVSRRASCRSRRHSAGSAQRRPLLSTSKSASRRRTTWSTSAAGSGRIVRSRERGVESADEWPDRERACPGSGWRDRGARCRRGRSSDSSARRRARRRPQRRGVPIFSSRVTNDCGERGCPEVSMYRMVVRARSPSATSPAHSSRGNSRSSMRRSERCVERRAQAIERAGDRAVVAADGARERSPRSSVRSRSGGARPAILRISG